MSADKRSGLCLSLCCGLLSVGTTVAAEEEAVPKLELLEYLGSWEASDEDWIIFTEVDESEKELTEERDNDPSPDGEKVAESNDEN